LRSNVVEGQLSPPSTARTSLEDNHNTAIFSFFISEAFTSFEAYGIRKKFIICVKAPVKCIGMGVAQQLIILFGKNPTFEVMMTYFFFIRNILHVLYVAIEYFVLFLVQGHQTLKIRPIHIWSSS
jgi:hypothetical protein